MYYANKYKELSIKKGKYISYNELINNEYGLPSGNWLAKHCPDDTVTNFSKFVEWCGFIPYYDVSKEKAIKTIYKMQSKLDRPLMYDDFRYPKLDEIGNHTIIKYWGTMNKMKEDLGLEIIQESMIDKQKSKEEMLEDIKLICNEIYIKEGRKTIIRSDFNNNNKCLTYQTYYKKLKEYGIEMRDFIERLGFNVVNSGCGMSHTYKDGELTMSQYEFQFSNFLRKKGLMFNKDYFRNVMYKNFIQNFDGLIDCDYVIYFNSKTIYVEIAGFLRDYEMYYKKNIPINIKSKERYRENLKFKEKLLNENKLNYAIIFPHNYNNRESLNLNNLKTLLKNNVDDIYSKVL